MRYILIVATAIAIIFFPCRDGLGHIGIYLFTLLLIQTMELNLKTRS